MAAKTNRIRWYRTALPPKTLTRLNARSDLKGLIYCCTNLALLLGTGTATLMASFADHWLLVLPLLLLHGTIGSFHINSVHELCHNTVFKTKWLNLLFVRIFGFLGWNLCVHFNASHANHHRYTLNTPGDGEVVLPLAYINLKNYLAGMLFNVFSPIRKVKMAWVMARGKWKAPWTRFLFPDDHPEKRQRLMRSGWSLLIGHGVILVVSVAMLIATGQLAWLMVPVVVSFSSCYGNWLQWLCNETQHVGMTGHVPDFRLCCRSIRLPWPVSFLYWHMEYHVEHHMYAAVPCYNLRKLNKAIRHDIPVAKGLFASWQQIIAIRRKQKTSPDYGHVPELPEGAAPFRYE